MKFLNQERVEKVKGKSIRMALYECQCGKHAWKIKAKVKAGSIKSCGCMSVFTKSYLESNKRLKRQLKEGTKERQLLVSRLNLWASSVKRSAA